MWWLEQISCSVVVFKHVHKFSNSSQGELWSLPSPPTPWVWSSLSDWLAISTMPGKWLPRLRQKWPLVITVWHLLTNQPPCKKPVHPKVLENPYRGPSPQPSPSSPQPASTAHRENDCPVLVVHITCQFLNLGTHIFLTDFKIFSDSLRLTITLVANAFLSCYLPPLSWKCGHGNYIFSM